MPSLKTRDHEFPVTFDPPAMDRIKAAGLVGVTIPALAAGSFFGADKASQKRQVQPLLKALWQQQLAAEHIGDEDLAVMVGSNVDRVMDCLRRAAIDALPDAEQVEAIARYQRETRRQMSAR